MPKGNKNSVTGKGKGASISRVRRDSKGTSGVWGRLGSSPDRMESSDDDIAIADAFPGGARRLSGQHEGEYQYPVHRDTAAYIDYGMASDDELPPAPSFMADADVGSHLDSKLISKIVQGRYVHFSSLLPSYRDTSRVTLDVRKGTLVTTSSNRRLFKFSEWTDAFINFQYIRGSAHPAEAMPLVKYFQTIKRIQGRGGNFVGYDEAFRSKHKGEAVIPWQKLDSEEMSWAMGDPGYTPYEEFVKERAARRSIGAVVERFGTGSRKMPMYRSSQPMMPSMPAYRSAPPLVAGQLRQYPRICFAFNDVRGCDRKPCLYAHACKRCFGPHRVEDCKQGYVRQR